MSTEKEKEKEKSFKDYFMNGQEIIFKDYFGGVIEAFYNYPECYGFDLTIMNEIIKGAISKKRIDNKAYELNGARIRNRNGIIKTSIEFAKIEDSNNIIKTNDPIMENEIYEKYEKTIRIIYYSPLSIEINSAIIEKFSNIGIKKIKEKYDVKCKLRDFEISKRFIGRDIGKDIEIDMTFVITK
jgi:hypothetical protein